MIFGIHLCAQECVWAFWTSPCLWGDPAGRSASLWKVRAVVRLDLLSFTCLIRQDSDGHSTTPPRKKSSAEAVQCKNGLNLFSIVHRTCPEHFQQRRRGEKKRKKNATTRKKPQGNTPKERRERQPQENADRRRREKTSRNQRRKGARGNLGQTGRRVVSLDTVFPARYSSLWTVVRPALFTRR